MAEGREAGCETRGRATDLDPIPLLIVREPMLMLGPRGLTTVDGVDRGDGK